MIVIASPSSDLLHTLVTLSLVTSTAPHILQSATDSPSHICISFVATCSCASAYDAPGCLITESSVVIWADFAFFDTLSKVVKVLHVLSGL